MKLFIFTIAVLSTITKITIAQPGPPGILWERTYFGNNSTSFLYVNETSDQGFIVGGSRDNSSESYNQTCVFRMDADGNLIWEYGKPGWYFQLTRDVEELADGGFICVGTGQPDVTIKFGLSIFRLDIDGNAVWVKHYGISDKDVRGQCVTQLPNGGFAVGGHIATPWKQAADAWVLRIDDDADAWVLRIDDNGDTLWTKTWEEGVICEVRQILYENNGLTVLMRSLDPDCPYIVRYDLDGNELCEIEITGLAGEVAQTMCLASDGGYIILTSGKDPLIAHVDSLGQVNWITTPSYAEYGRSISPTMDGGYILSGRHQTHYKGSFSKFSSDGTEEWWHIVDYNHPYFIMQLSQGGYIAAGKNLLFPTGQGDAGLIEFGHGHG